MTDDDLKRLAEELADERRKPSNLMTTLADRVVADES